MTEERSPIPATPEGFGREIRRLRKNAGLELEDIAEETKISLGILRGMEEGRFEVLPNIVFARNFVAQVAESVGCESEHLVGAFERAWSRHRVTSGTNPVLTLDQSSGMPVVKAWVWIPLGAAAVVIVAVVLAVVLLRSRQAREPLSGEQWGRSASVQRTAVEEESTVPSPLPMIEPVETQTAEGEDDGRTVEVEVRVLPGRECWVRSRDAAGRVTRRLLYGGERVVLESKDRLEITVGDASAVTLVVDGEVQTELGAPGQVRHFELTSAGIEILGAWRGDDDEES